MLQASNYRMGGLCWRHPKSITKDHRRGQNNTYRHQELYNNRHQQETLTRTGIIYVYIKGM